MQTSKRLLFSGLCFFLSCCTVRGIRYLPDEAIHFTKCDPALNLCPAHSSCDETRNGYYCACDNYFYNDKEKLTITYPGGECLERCNKGKAFPCACLRGYVSKLNENGLYECTDKCTNDSDCPSGASCKQKNCYCNEICKPPKPNCITLVKLGGICAEPSTTTSPLLTSNVNMGDTAVYTQSGVPTSQPAPSPTAVPLLTSSMNMGNTAAYTHQRVGETDYSQFTTSTVEISVTSHSISQKTPEESGATTSQPENYRCPNNSITEQEIERCTKRNNTHPSCTFLKSLANITEDACMRSNTNTSVQEVASQITNLLTQTLEKLDISDLQAVVIPIIENVETSLLASFSADFRNQQISTSEIEAEVKVAPDHCGRRSSFNLRVLGNTMEVPCLLVDFEGGGAMLILYKGLNARLNGSLLAALGNSDDITTEEVISAVVGGAITSSHTESLDPPVTFTLKHLTLPTLYLCSAAFTRETMISHLVPANETFLQVSALMRGHLLQGQHTQEAVKPSYTLRCVYWDTQNNVWSTHGCDTQLSEQVGSTHCVCTHLSTFAVIMAPTKIQVDDGLRVLSLIGLSISLVCLFLAFLTFILCRSLRSAHTSVITVLCGCLFLGQLLVLVGLQQTWNKILCSVIAGSLQFLFLCAFCWMSLESVLLFMTVRNLQAVNYMNSRRSHFPYVCLIGFGIPVTIMIISASLYPDIYGDQTYCWLKISHIWSFLGPVCMFISVNFILLALTFWLLRKKLASLNSNVSTLKHTRLLTFKALSQLFILGCTWIIGLFQFGSGSLVASYIFTICNSLQGLYIFLVHCLLNRQVREEYSRGLRRLWSRKSMPDTSSASTVHMTMKSSQTSEASKEDRLCIVEDKKR